MHSCARIQADFLVRQDSILRHAIKSGSWLPLACQVPHEWRHLGVNLAFYAVEEWQCWLVIISGQALHELSRYMLLTIL